jgi:hypothetical protein
MVKISENSNVVFFFGDSGIDNFIRGVPKVKVNLFYTEEDQQKYSERYHMSSIKDFFKFYQKEILRNPAAYGLFFAEKSVLNRINPEYIDKNILKNKPEKYFRDHLQLHLNTHTQHNFQKELELPVSKRKIDLYTEVDGKTYLFEIKWLGQSIANDGTKLSRPVTDSSAIDGVTQTLEYIEEMIENMGLNLKCGYLLVFDARLDKKPVDYQNYDFVPGNYRGYFESNFEKLTELKIDNTHPG